MSEKPKKKPSRRRNWLLLGLVVTCLTIGCGILLLYFWVDTAWDIDEEMSGDAAKARIEDILNAPSPSNATGFRLHYIAWQDFHARIRFEASPDAILLWLDENDFCFAELIENEPSYFFRDEPNLDWWQTNEASRYAIAEQCGNDPFYELVIDQSNPDSWIVYIVVFTT